MFRELERSLAMAWGPASSFTAGLDFPRVAAVRQRIDATAIADPHAHVRDGVARRLSHSDLTGKRIGVTVGSRGISHLPEIIRGVIDGLRTRLAEPFIVPAMGSHGGATAGGQTEVMVGYGIDEVSVGAPVRATMDVVEVGQTDRGVPVYLDRNVWESDGVVVVNRVKAHTAFKAPIESGLCKMLAVGLGKQRGAETMHRAGLARTIPEAAAVSLASGKVILGVAIVENAADLPMQIEVVGPEAFHDTDRALLVASNAVLPRVPFDHADVLVLDWIGKDLSGSGMDPNVIGMWRRLGGERVPDYRRIVVRDVTDGSRGNAIGIGWADVTTAHLVGRIDYAAMYMNCLTASAPDVARVPMTMPTDREAIGIAIRTSGGAATPDSVRLVRAHSTLRLDELLVSEALLPEVRGNSHLEIVGQLEPMRFDDAGTLLGTVGAPH
jgi:hypothetical protein